MIEATSPTLPARARHKLALVIIFFAFCIGGALVDRLCETREVFAMGQEGRAQAERKAKSTFADGTALRIYEEELIRNSLVRKHLAGPWIVGLLATGLDGGTHASRGKDGFMFLRNFVPRPKPGYKGAFDHGADLIAALARRLEVLGVRLLLVPIPDKSMVYGDKLPSYLKAHPQLYEEFLARLSSRGIAHVDLLTRLREARKSTQVFCRNDTHWTSPGALEAALAVAEAAGLAQPGAARTTRLDPTDSGPDGGDGLFVSGLHPDQIFLSGPTNWLLRTTNVMRTMPIVRITDLDGQRLSASDLTPRDENVRGILVGTSFAVAGGFDQYLQHATNSAVRVFSVAGGGTSMALNRALVEGVGSKLPEVIIWEFPIFNLLQNDMPFRGVEQAFASLPAPAFPLLRTLVAPMPTASWRGPELPLRRTPFQQGISGRLLTEEIMHPGNGLLVVRLDGSVTGIVHVSLGHGKHQMRVTWPPHVTTLQLPILHHPEHQDSFLSIQPASTDATLTLDRIELAVLAEPAAPEEPQTAPTFNWPSDRMILLDYGSLHPTPRLVLWQDPTSLPEPTPPARPIHARLLKPFRL